MTFSVDPAQSRTLALAATFVAEPLDAPLQFWADEAGLDLRPAFAPFDQLHQQLLDPASAFVKNEGGVNVALVRFEDWRRTGEEGEVGARVGALVEALRAYDVSAPLVVVRCPDGEGHEVSPGSQARQWESDLLSASDPARGVYVVPASGLLDGFGDRAYASPHGERLGQVPYTEEFFASMAGVLVRKAAALWRTPYKVIAVDCDGTLWEGVCGEVGPAMLELPPSFLAVQRFLVEQVEQGKVVCLCSKNEPEDVWKVFEYRGGMPLSKERITAVRLNWELKSDNLRSLAEELNVGLDSFIFIDDNPAERAEVRAHVPEVLTLELPEDPAARPAFLQATWAFDHLHTTDADRQRGAFYADEGRRREARRGTASFEEFLDGLGLEVDVEPLSEKATARSAQLTQRTNQFNTTGRRFTASELSAWAERPGRSIDTVCARDRFGDYGQVGVVLCEAADSELRVRGMMLSCRALGRSVEYRVLNALGARAQQHGLDAVAFDYIASLRNTPARQFIEAVASERADGTYVLTAHEAEQCRFEVEAVRVPASVSPGAPAAAEREPVDRSSEALRLARLAELWLNPDQVTEALHGGARPASAGPYEPPRTETEEALCAMWGDVLGYEEAGRSDDFFAFGGDSLKATVLLARLDAALGVGLPLEAVFEHRTPATLAAHALRVQLAALSPDELQRLLGELAPDTDTPPATAEPEPKP